MLPSSLLIELVARTFGVVLQQQRPVAGVDFGSEGLGLDRVFGVIRHDDVLILLNESHCE